MMDFLLNFPIFDLLFVLFLLFGFFTGLQNGVIRKSFRIGIVTIFMIVTYFAFVPFLSEFIEYNMLMEFNIPIKLNINESQEFIFYSIHDLFMFFQNIGIDNRYLATICYTLCNVICILILLPLANAVSILFSWLLFDLIIKKLFLNKKDENGKKVPYKPNAGSRVLGGVVGIAEWFIIGYVFSQVLATLTGGISEVIIPGLANEASDLYNILVGFNVDPSNIAMIKDVTTIANNTLNPTTSYLFKYFYLNDNSIWMFKGIKVSIDENGEEIIKSTSIKETFTIFYEQLISSLKEVSSSIPAE